MANEPVVAKTNEDEKSKIQQEQKTQVESNQDQSPPQTEKPTSTPKEGTSSAANKTASSHTGGLGKSQPFIKINNYGPFSTKELLSFTLKVNDFYPSCSLTVKTGSGIFLTSAFPKDGDLINVFIGNYSDEFKPIRADFLITSVSTSKSLDREGDEIVFFINGILNVPLLYADVCSSIKDVTSYEALFKIATDLNLGFASNEKKEKLQDKQTWIAPYISYIDWINDITKHSYKDDFSFYTSWIDQYSTLNFVNLNSTMSIPDDWKAKDGKFRGSYNQGHGRGEYTDHVIAPIILTNEREAESSNGFFKKFSLNNRAGIINLTNGYFRHLFFYDKNTEEIRNWEIKPSITKGSSKSKVVMQGRAGEDNYKNEKRYNYSGIQYSLPEHNVHKFWKHSYFQNHQNLNFISKMSITLELSSLNPNLYRGQVVPVIFMLTQHDERIKKGGKKDDSPSKIGLTTDRFLSGQYTILGIIYNYYQSSTSENDPTGYKGEWNQEVIIGRREWTVPDNLK